MAVCKIVLTALCVAVEGTKSQRSSDPNTEASSSSMLSSDPQQGKRDKEDGSRYRSLRPGSNRLRSRRPDEYRDTFGESRFPRSRYFPDYYSDISSSGGPSSYGYARRPPVAPLNRFSRRRLAAPVRPASRYGSSRYSSRYGDPESSPSSYSEPHYRRSSKKSSRRSKKSDTDSETTNNNNNNEENGDSTTQGPVGESGHYESTNEGKGSSGRKSTRKLDPLLRRRGGPRRRANNRRRDTERLYDQPIRRFEDGSQARSDAYFAPFNRRVAERLGSKTIYSAKRFGFRG
ncbi:unnamed protein product [Notodromas monacha]|uniref:Uncharacterized protein n=1 Tax=Notodromas monacha TaxID=399045 RepID=A0A7R9GEQ7_9CRUS|nr:unnamed protein product [Notodromas monacha]CAG0919989.1 unnamed protein product [Notodromas monacha]